MKEPVVFLFSYIYQVPYHCKTLHVSVLWELMVEILQELGDHLVQNVTRDAIIKQWTVHQLPASLPLPAAMSLHWFPPPISGMQHCVLDVCCSQDGSCGFCCLQKYSGWSCTLMSSGLWHWVGLQACTRVWAEHTASVFRIKEMLNMQTLTPHRFALCSFWAPYLNLVLLVWHSVYQLLAISLILKTEAIHSSETAVSWH
jgi:hypothetical protein